MFYSEFLTEVVGGFWEEKRPIVFKMAFTAVKYK
jgi:hypothetical protein